MGTDPKVKISVWKTRHKELIEKSTKVINDAAALVKHSQKRIRIAMGHEVEKKDNNLNGGGKSR